MLHIFTQTKICSVMMSSSDRSQSTPPFAFSISPALFPLRVIKPRWIVCKHCLRLFTTDRSMELHLQSKRKRRPNVRLGEIGELGFTASWLVASPHPRKQSSTKIKSFKAADEEEWSVVEPVASSPFERTEPPLRWIGSKRVSRGRQDDEGATLNSTPPQEDHDAAPMSSDFGQDAEEQANPSSHGHDEMQQGAIEDGPNRKGGRSRTPPINAEPRGMGFRASDRSDATPISGLQVTAGVTGWLQKLGLGKYSALFELHEVDTEVLPWLTLDDLREIGVDAVGARRKMFSHIQELR